MEYVADYLGSCRTSKGIGHRYECVRDYDMKVSRRLEYYLDQPDVDLEELYASLYRLAVYLLENRILISDIHARNILVQMDKEGGMHPVVVDGIGDRVAITALNVFPRLVESKIVRRWNRFSESALNGNAVLSL